MKVFHNLTEASKQLKACSVAIGNFDGVHLGHQALLKELIAYSQEHGLEPIVLTFFPHPVEVLRPEKKLERLTTASEKLELLKACGVSAVLVQKFDKDLAEQTPVQFVEKFLVDGLKAKSVHVGNNFCFGKNRSGNTTTLKQLCSEKGISLQVAIEVATSGKKIGSSDIRHLVSEGNVEDAAKHLGRPYFVTGNVRHGDKRGRTIGFPTANLHVPESKLLPKNGVYSVNVLWQGETYKAIANVGVRPTIQDSSLEKRVEVHIFNFSHQIYEEYLQVDFLKFIRDEKKFPSIEALKAQIKEDITSCCP